MTGRYQDHVEPLGANHRLLRDISSDRIDSRVNLICLHAISSPMLLFTKRFVTRFSTRHRALGAHRTCRPPRSPVPGGPGDRAFCSRKPAHRCLPPPRKSANGAGTPAVDLSMVHLRRETPISSRRHQLGVNASGAQTGSLICTAGLLANYRHNLAPAILASASGLPQSPGA